MLISAISLETEKYFFVIILHCPTHATLPLPNNNVIMGFAHDSDKIVR